VDDYAGRYYSDEVDATFIVALKEGRLTARRDNGENAVTLEAVDGGFRFRGGRALPAEMTVRFERGPDGAPPVLIVDAGRVRDIRFVRQPAVDR